MRIVIDSFVGAIVALAAMGAACAQGAAPAGSASAPMTAASRAIPARNPAIVAAENAKEPGVQRPEERVIPQISVPLKSRAVPSASASAVLAGAPGVVNDGAARCLAIRDAAEKAACERRLAASSPR